MREKNMNIFRRKKWSPYAVGAAIGGLETLAMLTAKRPLGITTPFEEAAVMISEKIPPESPEAEESGKNGGPEIDWEWALVVGVVLGSLLSSRMSSEPQPPTIPRLWRQQVSPSPVVRYGAAVTGGALMMFGARMAKGCTSGHGISGTMQFAASSWLFSSIIFGAGAMVANTLLRRRK
ncbi:MAG: YeeE/YedE thiosulfate transporter family protein [Desulfobulbaceae bacterium]|nr:YeeE/YedE thiosulfate transporter family protein [Desulfobulbaceae bacterium]